MYRCIVLAYDSSREGARALREGARIAATCAAKTHLLAVMQLPAGVAIGEGFDCGKLVQEAVAHARSVLDLGLTKLRDEYRVEATGHLLCGDPVDRISALAAEVGADLIVVGHQKRGPLSRWWSTSVGASLIDSAPCSVLIALKPA